MSDPISLYHWHKTRGDRPALLDSRGTSSHFLKRSVLGINPTQCLEVREGILYKNGVEQGSAETLLDHLQPGDGNHFFPAWIGFLSYEFARYFGLPTCIASSELPEAAFYFYEEGYRWEHGELCEAPSFMPATTHFAPLPTPSVELTCDFERDAFLHATHEIQERIRSGHVYQVNLSQRFHFDASGIDPLSIYHQLTSSNPSPFMGLLEGDDWALISGSPERLFRYHKGSLHARPIAGTRPRGQSSQQDEDLELELLHSRKERAEHTMLVDLLRNDLARVSQTGSVHVPEAFSVERYSHVMHLVSQVQGRSQASLQEVLRAIFPGGTITGAPKESTMQCIAELEPVPRGAYTGSLGYVSSGFGADFNILIRSLAFAKDTGYFSAGAGIVMESVPESEYDEVQQKALSLRHVLKCGKAGVDTKAVRRTSSWEPPRPTAKHNARVIFVENHDSFSHNIVDYLRMFGCKVWVVDHHQMPDVDQATHVVLGPGPGEPFQSGKLMKWLSAAIDKKIPVLGICLGHQALGLHFGAKLTRATRAIHGEADTIIHRGQGLFAGVDASLTGVRYHSLVLSELSSVLEAHAHSSDGHIMAIAHKELHAYGVQYHLESFLSENGLQILQNFLRIDPCLPKIVNS